MQILDKTITPRQAADQFAAAYGDGRRVGTIVAAPDAALKFQFAGGLRWYAVKLLPDYSGFDVSPEGATA